LKNKKIEDNRLLYLAGDREKKRKKNNNLATIYHYMRHHVEEDTILHSKKLTEGQVLSSGDIERTV